MLRHTGSDCALQKRGSPFLRNQSLSRHANLQPNPHRHHTRLCRLHQRTQEIRMLLEAVGKMLRQGMLEGWRQMRIEEEVKIFACTCSEPTLKPI
jgi:hypothetical protein